MPPPSKPTSNGTAKGKSSKNTQSTSGSTTPIPNANQNVEEPTASGKPDKAAYDAEQEKIKSEIEALQAKLVSFFFFHSTH